MAVKISGSYVGGKKVKLTHEPSGAQITTAAPKDNEGDGSSFSPTDLVASATAACMLTLIANVAERSNIDVTGTTFSVEKHMSQDPRRISALPININMPQSVPLDSRKKLEAAALSCPVYKSIHPDIVVQVVFSYDGPTKN